MIIRTFMMNTINISMAQNGMEENHTHIPTSTSRSSTLTRTIPMFITGTSIDTGNRCVCRY
jgi:hypothetical protein